jgi:hypothetical protein
LFVGGKYNDCELPLFHPKDKNKSEM